MKSSVYKIGTFRKFLFCNFHFEMLGIHCSCSCFVSATFTLQVSPYQNIGFSPPQNYWIFLLKCLIFMQFLAVFGNNSNHWPIIQHKIIPIILLWSNVLSKISTTLKKGKNLGTLTHIIPGTYSHKSLSNVLDSKVMTLFS